MGALEMTEREAWLELAETFGADRPLPMHPRGWSLYGICSQLGRLYRQGTIPLCMEERMTTRLDECFNPNSVDLRKNFFWDAHDRRPTRDLRATACCFLAAMCEEEER